MRDARIKPRGQAQQSGRVRLARWLIRGRMTQAEAAELIGISRVKLNQYLNGESRPSLETAIRIEDATGVGIRLWLIDDPRPVVVTDGNTGGTRTGETLEGGTAIAVADENEVNNNLASRTQRV